MVAIPQGAQARKLYPFALVALLIGMVFGLSLADKPVPPKGMEAPEAEFSSMRAFADLTDLLKENVPHPVGSEANKVIRDRIIEKLSNRDFEVELQEDFTCQARWGACANVENVIATKKGTEGNGTILLMSHYDSVPAGAAATDDGYGVAVALEAARALEHTEAFKNNLIFLVTDAEEVGLIGAEAFATHHPLMEEVDIVINIESRGTSGQSAMFETGAENDMLLDIYKGAVTRPFANSLTYEVYKRMPNDTDYTVFRTRDIPGLNFASTRSASRYHSVLDDLEHLDKSTLQQHGDNALSMIKAFGNMDLSELKTRSGEATYYDFYTLFLVKWPSSWNVPLSILGLIVVAGLLVLQFKQKQTSAKNILWALAATLSALISVVAIAAILGFPLGSWQNLHPLDHPNAWPGKAAVLIAALLAASTAAYLFRNKAETKTLISVNWLLIAIVSTALAFLISGASYIALAPMLAFMLGLLVDFIRADKKITEIDFMVSAHLGFFTAFYIGIYHYHLLDLVLSFNMSAVKISTLALAIFAFMPLAHAYFRIEHASFKKQALVLSAGVLMASIWSMTLSGFTKDKPDPLNVLYIQDEQGASFLTLEHLLWREDSPSPYFEELGFEANPYEYPLPTWVSTKRHKTATPSLKLTAPQFDIVYDETTDGLREIEAEIAAGHGGYSITLMFSENTALRSLTVKGEAPIADLENWPRDLAIEISGTQQGTFRIRMELENEEPFSLTLAEQAQLPSSDAINALVAKRPVYANSTQNGDRSIVLRKIEF